MFQLFIFCMDLLVDQDLDLKAEIHRFIIVFDYKELKVNVGKEFIRFPFENSFLITVAHVFRVIQIKHESKIFDVRSYLS